MPVHDLGRLVSEAAKFLGDELMKMGERLRPLTAHYYAARYPNAARRLGISYTREVAEACLEAMRELWSILRPHLRP